MNLTNKQKYLSQELIQKCFAASKHNRVNKQQTGNGFSYGFLTLPVKIGMVNVMIAPNKAVVMDKQEAYNKGELGTDNRIKFFYKESQDSDFSDADILMFVADSFLLRKDAVKNISHKVDKVLHDECHSTEIQSLFRYRLIDFYSKLESIFYGKAAIVSVTASPNLYSKVDIHITNELLPSQTIHLSKNRFSALNRIKKDIQEGRSVVVATNNKTVIYKLKNKSHVLEANFIVGNGLMSSLVELMEVKHNPESKLTIISSRAFEGYDINYTDASLYFFEDRASPNGYETFYISNLYQAISRTRRGAAYIEYCRADLANVRSSFRDIDKEVNRFIERDDYSIHQKQSKGADGKFYKLHPYVIFTQNTREGSDDYGSFSVKRNEVAISLYKEQLEYDKPFPSEKFKSFLENRKLTIKDLNEQQSLLPVSKLQDEFKESMLLKNGVLISRLDLFGKDYTLRVEEKAKDEYYLRDFNTYLRRKNYNGQRSLTLREREGMDLLTDEKRFNKLLKGLVKAYNERSIAKYGKIDSKPYREVFKVKSIKVLYNLIQMFVNEDIVVPPNWVVNRNYNLLTQIGVDELKLVAEHFSVSVTEVDIEAAFIRIIYSLCGFDLPADIYGVNKVNKLKINKFLNNFFYNEKKATPKKIQKARARDRFLFFGFNEVVVDYLINNFFESDYRGNLFNFLTFYEKQLISKLKLEAYDSWEHEGVVRRHDSILIFNSGTNLVHLNHLDFLGKKGWFKIEGASLEVQAGLSNDLHKWSQEG
jgi:hypothetical protein